MTIPNVDTVERLASALQVSAGWLAFGWGANAGVYEPVEGLRCDDMPQRLALARQVRGLSRKALAERAGVSRAMLLYVEEGKSTPSVTVAGQIAKGLDVAPAWLIYNEGDMDIPPRRRKQGEGFGPSED